MSAQDLSPSRRSIPEPRAMLELIKPVTWFPPMWAYLCGAVSSNVPIWENKGVVVLGIVLAGPIVCGMSQAANDWCDRHVDAINEPHRPIPSGRIPGLWGLYIAIAMSLLSLVVGWQLGSWGFVATLLGVAAAWAYSVEPIRLKRSGWWGPGLVGLAYEGLPWITGAAVLLATADSAPGFPIVMMATLYALGAHGIMTINDFKAIEGDRKLGIKSLPAVYGPEVAAKIACTVMGLAQSLVITMLYLFSKPYHATAVLVLLCGQFWAMSVWMRDPEGKAPWYNGTGVVMYVSGMMITAFAIRGFTV
ncbi:chlorophyll synthase ChlG [Rhodobacter capsulatus]|uniref:chlorophyll synthase ChlG n=1 Tax=Rhodobacter capsulatus TaxID=1061 RepID=UPI0003D3B119|nr:chlorophyll synthase ChlG [Rhodobacter capsulatus]ETD89789.1 bacteriochlorophyll/chlorophyll a synthase [Rhodobacter capsulatus YW2]